MNNNREVLHQMRKVFYPNGMPYLDWMGFVIDDDNKPSYHHIFEKRNLFHKEATVSNGAYLGKRSHELLHRIELRDKELYDQWNNLFRLINYIHQYPDDHIWNVIFELRDRSIKLDEKAKKATR